MVAHKSHFWCIIAGGTLVGNTSSLSVSNLPSHCHLLNTQPRTTSPTFHDQTQLWANENENENDDGGNTIQMPVRSDPVVLLSSSDENTQKLGIAAIVGGLTAGTFVSGQILNYLEVVLPTSLYDPFYTVLPVIVGTLISAAGVAHFAIEDTFTSLVPPRGTWGGLWQVPAPGAEQLGLTYEQYHSYWTGIAEIGGGILLIMGRFGFIVPSIQIPAALLFLLVAAVTPANTYMFTHDPDVPRIPPLPYPWGHAARGTLQVLLLAVFWKWANMP
mmetsp:Transcript_25935/g.29866  ORF Transcript_25935/g.29866 Transcript_25935/m.29866 type:complete len:273 (+) Transcript_25935:69-887(+)